MLRTSSQLSLDDSWLRLDLNRGFISGCDSAGLSVMSALMSMGIRAVSLNSVYREAAV